MAEELVETVGAHVLDEASLERYLVRHVPGMSGPLRVRKFAGGQSNPTYKIDAGDQSYVLRKKPPGALLATAHMVDREHRILSALAGTDVPVPRPLLYCKDATVIGTEFFVMEYVAGRIFWDPGLPEVPSSDRPAIYEEMARVLAKLHSADFRSLGLADYGKPGNYFARQIKRWSEQYVAASTEPVPEMDALIAWLPAHVPDDDTTTLVHGDFRLDNMIFHPTEPRVLAVLDWELSTLGHPLADVAYNCMPYHLPPPGSPPLAGIDGIPKERDYLGMYLRHVHRAPIDDFSFYLAFSLFRYASIVQGVYHRGLLGNSSSGADAIRYRERAIAAAQVAWSLVR